MKQIKFYSFIVPLIIGLIALASLGVTVNEKLQGEAPAKFAEGQGEPMLGGLISKPYTFSPSTVIRSSEINSNYDTLYTLVNGNIDNDNIDASAEIAYTKISGSAILANPVASQTITPGGATYQFIVKGASSQSVDIFDIQNSSAVSQLSVDSSGYTNIDSDYLYFSTSTERIQSTGSGDMTFTDTNSGATWTLTQLANASALTEGDGVDISANVISVIPSTTLGYTFDTGGYLYRPVDSTLTATSTGLSVNTSTVVSQIATSTPTADKIPIADGSGEIDIDWLPTLLNAIAFSDGSDGEVTLSASTTLISDMYYNNLTVDSGVVLNTGGYRIFVKGTLTNNGTISRDGNIGGNGTDATAGFIGDKGVGGVALASGTIYGGLAGGDGADGVKAQNSTTDGKNGTAGGDLDPSITNVNGTAGGSGGTGGLTPGTGGTGGTATIETNNFNFGAFTSGVLDSETTIKYIPYLLNGNSSFNTLSSSASCGGGGSGYAIADPTSNASSGGAGGAGGNAGIVYIQANIIINNGTISVIGGAGGDAGESFTTNGAVAAASGSGGGAGGSGGLVVLVYTSYPTTGTVTISGGAGGTGAVHQGTAGSTGGSSDGNNGSSGNAGKYIQIKLN